MKFTKTVSFFGLALLMIFSLAVSAFAADITVNDGVDGAEYSAYKLLNATDGGDGKFAYSFNEKYEGIIKSVTGKETLADIIDYLDNLTAADLQTFANNVYIAIVAAAVDADYNTDNDVFSNVAQGYYLIAETKTASASDTYSLAILKTTGKENETIDSKESLPTVEKLIWEQNDSNNLSSIGKAADYDIGDVIDYFIMGTVSDKYEYYNSYYYSFVDTMEAGLTYNNDAVVYLSNSDNPTANIDITQYFSITATEHGFTAEANLKEIPDVTIGANSNIIVEYTCTLNENAVVGSVGNKNVVYLEYENSPFAKADGELSTTDKPQTPGKTVEDVNIVFTFTAKVDKIDTEGNPLAGAGFTLYKWNGTTDAWESVGSEITGVTTFDFVGLDSGEYKLCETTVPAGFNKCDDIVFFIEADYGAYSALDSFISLVVKNEDDEIISDEEGTAIFAVDVTAGTVATAVENVSGAELPSTGGIGTTVFYILGGVLVAAALVLLIAKIRMSKD